MGQTKTIDLILDDISQLPLEEQEMVNELLKMRIIDIKREGISQDWQQAKKDYAKGKVQSGIDNLFKR